jgi:hypothetical protein
MITFLKCLGFIVLFGLIVAVIQFHVSIGFGHVGMGIIAAAFLVLPNERDNRK